jgi:hypothetical protein
MEIDEISELSREVVIDSSIRHDDFIGYATTLLSRKITPLTFTFITPVLFIDVHTLSADIISNVSSIKFFGNVSSDIRFVSTILGVFTNATSVEFSNAVNLESYSQIFSNVLRLNFINCGEIHLPDDFFLPFPSVTEIYLEGTVFKNYPSSVGTLSSFTKFDDHSLAANDVHLKFLDKAKKGNVDDNNKIILNPLKNSVFEPSLDKERWYSRTNLSIIDVVLLHYIGELSSRAIVQIPSNPLYSLGMNIKNFMDDYSKFVVLGTVPSYIDPSIPEEYKTPIVSVKDRLPLSFASSLFPGLSEKFFTYPISCVMNSLVDGCVFHSDVVIACPDQSPSGDVSIELFSNYRPDISDIEFVFSPGNKLHFVLYNGLNAYHISTKTTISSDDPSFDRIFSFPDEYLFYYNYEKDVYMRSWNAMNMGRMSLKIKGVGMNISDFSKHLKKWWEHSQRKMFFMDLSMRGGGSSGHKLLAIFNVPKRHAIVIDSEGKPTQAYAPALNNFFKEFGFTYSTIETNVNSAYKNIPGLCATWTKFFMFFIPFNGIDKITALKNVIGLKSSDERGSFLNDFITTVFQTCENLKAYAIIKNIFIRDTFNTSVDLNMLYTLNSGVYSEFVSLVHFPFMYGVRGCLEFLYRSYKIISRCCANKTLPYSKQDILDAVQEFENVTKKMYTFDNVRHFAKNCGVEVDDIDMTDEYVFDMEYLEGVSVGVTPPTTRS